MNKHFARIILSMLLFSTYLLAGTTGKLAGTVTDKESGEPLIGCNVIVEGVGIGAATDSEGRFVILQVKPGIYNVKTSYIGYHSLTMGGVKVRIDQTTSIEFLMDSDAIEIPTVFVTAERSLVYKDITSTKREISEEQIADLPSVESTSDILARQGGFYSPKFSEAVTIGGNVKFEPKDPSLKGINIRGSRGGDALILIDGFPSNHPVYGGYDVMNLNVEDIENIEILTGAFSAEYGQGESAVINITTKSGSDKYHGGINLRTDNHRLWGDHYNKDRLSVNLSGPDPISSKLLPKLGLKIPGSIKFFATLTSSLTNTEYNNLRVRDPLFKIGSTWINERQDNSLGTSIKLDYKISGNIKTMFSWRQSVKRWSQFDWDWFYYPDHTTRYSNENQQLQWNVIHTLSNKTFHSITVGLTKVKYSENLNGRTPSDFWVVTDDTLYSIIDPPTQDPLTQFFSGDGYVSNWAQSEDQVVSIKWDFTSQMLTEHMVKIGAQLDFKKLNNEVVSGGGISLSPYGRYLYLEGDEYPEPPGSYTAFGNERWLIQGDPIVGGLYLTDKYELAGLILNVGVRADFLMLGDQVNNETWKEQWEQATGLVADWSNFKYQIDPRFGISFPISDRTVFYFSYGHFNTLPGMEHFLRDPYSGGFTGNPHLDYIKTVKNEFGFTYQFHNNWVIDFKNYNKEISGQIGSLRLDASLGLPIQLSDNRGYSRVRGLELSLKNQNEKLLNGDLIYTLQWANGYSSSSFDDYIRSQNNLPNPIEEYRLNWDLRHQVVMRGTLSAKKGQHYKLLGVKLPDNWKITFQSQFYSGLPYTPGTHDLALQQVMTNTEEAPFHLKTSMKIEKKFSIGKHTVITAIDIDNVFNELTVNPSQAFNVWSGQPFKYGDTQEDTNTGWDYYEMRRVLDPRRFGEGRHVDITIEYRW